MSTWKDKGERMVCLPCEAQGCSWWSQDAAEVMSHLNRHNRRAPWPVKVARWLGWGPRMLRKEEIR